MPAYREKSQNDIGLSQQDAKSLYKRAHGRHSDRFWESRNREEYHCPKCGRGVDDIDRFEVHHIDRNPLNGHPLNLVALCRRCHYIIHGRTPPQSLEQWKSGFLSIGEG